jgi:hypothetical protein
MEGRQKTTNGVGKVTKDLREAYRNQEEDPNGDRETAEADMRDGKPSENELVAVEKGERRRTYEGLPLHTVITEKFDSSLVTQG